LHARPGAEEVDRDTATRDTRRITVGCMRIRPPRTRAGITLAAAALLAVLLSACASSPKSTFVDAGGETVTVHWADYPGHAYSDSNDVLQASPTEEVESVSAGILGGIEQRLTAEFAVEWENGPAGGNGFHPHEGNGSGGKSFYVTFNSVTRESLSIPASTSDWDRILGTIDEALASAGFGAVKLENIEPALTAETAEGFGSDDPDRQWLWSGTAHSTSQWIMVSLVNVDRDPSGDAESGMKSSIEHGWNPRSISLTYGATTISAADRARFIEAVEPFAGLARPEATTSD
jgi:hypothetical protein